MRIGNERGMVLLLVLVVITLLSALLSEFAFSTLIDMRLAETFRDTTRAEYLARGGITAGRMILQTDKNNYDAKDDPNELWAVGVQDYPLAEGAVTVKIDDLDGRLVLNELVDAAGNMIPVYRDRFVRLCNELGLDNPDALADALIDWIDKNQEPSPDGAEDAYYLTRTPPYEATDDYLQSIDELALIRGFDAETIAQLSPFVTSVGSGKLNINTAAPELLRSWDATTPPGTVDALLDRRSTGPFKDIKELQDTLGVPAFTAINSNLDLTVKSSYYQINSQGRVNDGVRRMQAIIRKTGDQLLWQKVN